MGASGESREFCRVDKSTPVRCRKLEKLSENRYAKLGHISAEATNFGGGGLLLKVGENFAVGDYLLLEIALPSEKIPVKALGQVMRFLVFSSFLLTSGHLRQINRQCLFARGM